VRRKTKLLSHLFYNFILFSLEVKGLEHDIQENDRILEWLRSSPSQPAVSTEVPNPDRSKSTLNINPIKLSFSKKDAILKMLIEKSPSTYEPTTTTENIIQILKEMSSV